MVRYIVAPGGQFRNETELGDAKARKALRSVVMGKLRAGAGTAEVRGSNPLRSTR
jgi:hypothetical protein